MINGDKWLNPDDWVCLTWTRRGYFQYELSDLHSAAAEPGPSPQGTRSFGPAQKQSTTTAQSFIHQTRWPKFVYLEKCACVLFCTCGSKDHGQMAYLSLPLSPSQRSSSPGDVSAGSSFQQLPSGSSGLAQCVGMELKHPIINMYIHKKKDSNTVWE